MLDASKAFNRVNFRLLFQKLITRNVTIFIVRILAMWYDHQKICIRWSNAISSSFTISNSVKQGGIISPILFNVYKDGLNVLLYRWGTYWSHFLYPFMLFYLFIID